MNREVRRAFSCGRTRMLLLILAVVSVVSVGVFAAACGGDETTTTAAPATDTTAAPATETTSAPQADLPATIKVGAVVPITGRYAGLGGQVKTGYELAVKDINDAGGVDIGGTKIPIELTLLDDESDPTKTVQQLETQASNGAVAYLGGAGSDLHAAAAGIAEKNKIPYLGIAFALESPHKQGFKYLFSPFAKSKDQAMSTFDVLDSLDPKPANIAVFKETTDWGKELEDYWTAEAGARGYTIKVYEYAPGTTDFSSLILPAKDSGAEVLLGLPNPPDGLAMMKQIKELDWNAKVYLLIRAPDPPTFGENLGVDSDGVMLMPGWNPGVNFPGAADMVQRHMDEYGKPAVALTGPAYACVQILADSISRAGSVDPAAIRDAMAATDMDTVIGPVTFNEDGTGNVVNVVNQWQGGKQALVWPPDQAKADIIYPAVPWKDR